ncbi:hypothetical protein NHX12_033711, partial [Muraenolepis orangiensis]
GGPWAWGGGQSSGRPLGLGAAEPIYQSQFVARTQGPCGWEPGAGPQYSLSPSWSYSMPHGFLQPGNGAYQHSKAFPEPIYQSQFPGNGDYQHSKAFLGPEPIYQSQFVARTQGPCGWEPGAGPQYSLSPSWSYSMPHGFLQPGNGAYQHSKAFLGPEPIYQSQFVARTQGPCGWEPGAGPQYSLSPSWSYRMPHGFLQPGNGAYQHSKAFLGPGSVGIPNQNFLMVQHGAESTIREQSTIRYVFYREQRAPS